MNKWMDPAMRTTEQKMHCGWLHITSNDCCFLQALASQLRMGLLSALKVLADVLVTMWRLTSHHTIPSLTHI